MKILIWTLLLLSPLINGYKVLFLVPFPAPSHWLWCRTFAEELLRRGHEVTAVTNYRRDTGHPNYTEVIIEPMLDLPAHFPIDDIFNLKYSSDWSNLLLFYRTGLISTEHAFNDAKVQQLIRSEHLHFDVIILEQFNHDALLLFGHKFNAPIVTIATLGHADYLDHAMGLITPWSHVPHNMLTYTDQMSFTQRSYNLALSLVDILLRRYHYMPQMQQLADKYFTSADDSKPSILELERSIAIRLVNSHTTTSHPRPSMPGLINVAGAHICKPKALPSDIQTFLDSADQTGVIYFSLGSYVKSTDMPPDKLNAFVESFRNVKQKVLWKFENDSIANLPPNVMVRKWLPQSDVLAHRNVVLFVTHGGVFGTQEGLYRGIPMLMIPFYGDQFRNSIKSVIGGYAIMLPFSEVSAKNLNEKLQTILNDEQYAIGAKEKSILFRDNPMTPLDESMFWIEYAARHKGTEHLRSHAANMPWYVYLHLDVLGLLFIGIFVVVKIILVLCRIANGLHVVTESKKRN